MGLRSGRRGRRALRGRTSAAALAALLACALVPTVVLALAQALGLASPAQAQGRGSATLQQTPVLLTANEITYDQDLDIVTATGNVEISQNDRVLHADTVSYNRRVSRKAGCLTS